MEIYSIRWSIEVFFKEAKQHLGLCNCQSRDFDAQIANVTISCILYIFLAYYRRINDYETHCKDRLDFRILLYLHNQKIEPYLFLCTKLKVSRN